MHLGESFPLIRIYRIIGESKSIPKTSRIEKTGFSACRIFRLVGLCKICRAFCAVYRRGVPLTSGTRHILFCHFFDHAVNDAVLLRLCGGHESVSVGVLFDSRKFMTSVPD